jgi:hypothetical protein
LVKHYQEVIDIHDNLITARLLIMQLIELVEDNPYPGRLLSVPQFAAMGLPDARFRWAKKGVPYRGEKLWRELFSERRLFDRDLVTLRFRFPVKVEVVSIAEIEEKLYLLCNEDRVICAKGVANALNLVPTSKAYARVKKQLQERNWIWKMRKVGGNVEKIVIAPERKGNRVGSENLN